MGFERVGCSSRNVTTTLTKLLFFHPIHLRTCTTGREFVLLHTARTSRTAGTANAANALNKSTENRARIRKMKNGGLPTGKRMVEGNREAPAAERDIFAERKRLGELIDTATKSPLLHLEDRALSSIKALVRASDSNVQAAFDFLLDCLKKNNSQIRYLAVLLVDELVTRSKLFRGLLVAQFETFLRLSVGFRVDYALPQPDDKAALLRKKSIELVEKWKDMFGQHYMPIRLAHDYLKNTLKLTFPNVQEVHAQVAQQRREREERTQELLKRKFHTLKDEFPNLKADVESTLDQIDECLQILAPPPLPPSTAEPALHSTTANIDNDGDGDEEEFESYGVESLRHLRDVVEEQETVPHESTDNSALFDTLRDLYKLLSTRHLVNSQDALATLIRVDPEEDRQSRDTILREIIDLRNLQLKVRAKCEGLGIQRIDSNAPEEGGEELDDEIWEQGDVVVTVEDITTPPSSASVETSSRAIDAASSSSNSAVNRDNESRPKQRKREAAAVGIKHDLLKQAPVLPWGSFLDTWGSQSAVPANPRGLEFENHWGKVDYDVMIPAEKIAEINVRASYYKAPQVDIPPCRAPLRSGGFCQRRDLRKCPLHGPIRPRDEEGNVIPDAVHAVAEPSSRAEEVGIATSDQRAGDDAVMKADSEADTRSVDPKQLAEQAIGNVRRMDERARAEARRHRAKRTREHNEACLRDAALSERRLGFGEALGEALGDGNGSAAADSRAMKSRGGLLVRRRPPVKERLARRLLNGRVTDATVRQQARDQEAAYRESFPNQW